ncbi:MAG: GAF domain-containing protein, partial [Desulfatiglandales bacterium]
MHPSKAVHGRGTAASGICSVTGRRILRRPEWTDVSLGENSKLTVSIIGEGIIWTQPSGYGRLPDVQKYAELVDKVASKTFPEGKGYVQIEDHSNLHGISLRARRFLINYIKRHPQRLGLIFYGTSQILKTSIQLAKRLHLLKLNVQIVNDYSSAVALAVKMLPDGKARLEDSPGLSPHTTRNPDWFLQCEDYSLRFEVIDSDVFHGTTTGLLKKEHIAPSLRLQEKVAESMVPAAQSYYYVLGLKRPKGISRDDRKVFIDAILELYEKYPFQMLIFYGANRLLSAAINLAGTLVPFRVRVVNDLNSALKLIAQDRSESLKTFPLMSATESITSDLPRKYVDELLYFLGNIYWESEGFDDGSQGIEPSHPLKPVFNALTLIKMDLDALSQERNRTEEALQQRAHELKLINQAGQAFNSTLDLDKILYTVMEEVCRLLDVIGGSIWLTDPESGELVCRQATGHHSKVVSGWRLAFGEGLVGWVASQGESLIVP